MSVHKNLKIKPNTAEQLRIFYLKSSKKMCKTVSYSMSIWHWSVSFILNHLQNPTQSLKPSFWFRIRPWTFSFPFHPLCGNLQRTVTLHYFRGNMYQICYVWICTNVNILYSCPNVHNKVMDNNIRTFSSHTITAYRFKY